MSDGFLVYRGSQGRDAGRIVRVSVRACPDPAAAVAALQARFGAFDSAQTVTWEEKR